MQTALAFLIRHGSLVVFTWVLLEQLGLPVPSFPILLAAGAVAGSGRVSLAGALSVAIFAAFLSDSFWFFLGRQRGNTVLRWVCKISLEPDSCVRRTEEIYLRHGARSLLFAKFIPGLGTVAPSLAGVFRMPARRFAFFDALGALLWAGSYIGLGYALSNQLEDVGRYAFRLGQSLGVLLAAALLAYIGRKYFQRQRFFRQLRIARITAPELKQMLERGEQVQIIDLRHSLDFEAEPFTLPGAIHADPEDLDEISSEIAQDRDVILYCT